ncbi:hypothetical protein ACFCWG_17775 [Streptomyces sp. NPDC056390]|uniref:hypothetical protein n=1 Tax=Streptomyces sp. NPDC056390 TaxID=3345806 RepID=UPI0035D5E3DC
MPPLVLGLAIGQFLSGRWATDAVRLRLVLVVGMLLNVTGLLLLPTLGAGARTVVLTVCFAVRDTPRTPSPTPWLRPETCDGRPNETTSPH